MIKMSKHDIFLMCQDLIAQKMEIARKGMESAQFSANQESKSSAGDKYETGRAMAQIERDKYAAQFAEALKLKGILDKLDMDKHFESCQLGALITTTSGKYFLSIGLGKVNVKGEDFYVVSPSSPIGLVLLGKKNGQEFDFQGVRQQIMEII